jgi:hypothetical protein
VPWMQVQVALPEDGSIENVINTDTIIRVGSLVNGGSYIMFVDGSTLRVLDSMSEIVEVVLKADEKKAKNGLPTNQR